jgi:hypothetical protein
VQNREEGQFTGISSVNSGPNMSRLVGVGVRDPVTEAPVVQAAARELRFRKSARWVDVLGHLDVDSVIATAEDEAWSRSGA